MNERLKEIRRFLKMSQEDMGKWLGISKSGVSEIESGRRRVTEQHIIMLCSNHNVNENWLRTGEGEMFVKLTKDEEIAAFIGNVLREEDDSFKKNVISGLSALDDDGWRVLEMLLKSISKNKD